MIEGEEECGSDCLEDFVVSNKEKLTADVIIISDTSIINNENQSITIGLRGLSYMEVELTGPNRDLHSGTYGGAVNNPINELCKIISSLKDEKGKILIPGFYDDVKSYDQMTRDEINKVPFDINEFKSHIKIGDVQKLNRLQLENIETKLEFGVHELEDLFDRVTTVMNEPMTDAMRMGNSNKYRRKIHESVLDQLKYF